MIDFSAMQPQAPPPSYWWTDPSGNPRPGTAPGADDSITGPILRRVAALVQSVPRAQPMPQFHPTAVPGWLQQLRGAPDPGAAFLHADPMYQASVARRQAMLMRPTPTIRRGLPLGLQSETPGIGFNRLGFGIENLHPATPGVGHLRRGAGIETLNPGLGL